MSEPTANQEVSARAILDRSPMRPPVFGTKEYIIAQTREALLKNGAEEAARSITERGVSGPSIEISVASNVRDGSERKVGSRTESLRNVAQAKAEMANKFAREGFDKLSDAEKRSVRTQVEVSLGRLSPQLKTDFSAMNAVDRDRVINDILTNPRYADIIGELLGKRLDVGPPENQLPKIASEAKEKIDEIDKNLRENARLLAEQGKKQTDATDKLHKEFETSSSGTQGTYEKELSDLQTGAEARRQEVEVIERDKLLLQADADEKEEMWKGVLGGRIKVSDPDAFDAIRDAAKNARQELVKKSQRLLEIQQQESRMQWLQNRKKQFEEDVESAENEKNRLDEEKLKLQAQKAEIASDKGLEDLQLKAHEASFVADLENLFDRAAAEYVNRTLNLADQEQIEVLKKVGGPMQKSVEDVLQKRWGDMRRGLLGREKYVFDKDEVNSDFKILLDGNPTALMDKIFGAIKAKDVTVEQKSEVVTALLRKKIQTGGMTTGEYRRLFDSPWSDDFMSKALEENHKFNEEFDRIKNEIGFKGTTGEFIKKHKFAIGSVILLALLGLVGPTTAAMGISSAARHLATR